MTGIRDDLQATVARQRAELKQTLEAPLRALAQRCSEVWGDRKALDAVLQAHFESVPHVRFLYALDTRARQISDNVAREGLIEADYGRDRSHRPYMREAVPATGFLLSKSYISLRERRPGLTAIQIVRDAAGRALGFVGADFYLQDLPHTRSVYEEPRGWRQIKGDPSIRGLVFHQTRSESEMDRHMDTVLGVVEALMVDHGVFHIMLHFSSSRAVCWTLDDPYRYRLLDIQTMIDPDSCLAYPRRTYPDEALVPAARIRGVLDGMRSLRFMDETFYLRTGTLNLFNGIVGLTFSCDGSHYVPYDEFLKMDVAFWMGTATS